MQTQLSHTRAALVIEPIDERGLPDVVRLAHEIWPVAYEGILKPAQLTNILNAIYTLENLQQEMRDGHRFWLAYRGTDAVAFASAYRENEDVIFLRKIYVDCKLQGSGIGRALIATIEKTFQPAEEMRLLVNPHNTPAQAFYTRMGFSNIGVQPIRMGDWSFDDFIFSRSIKNEGSCTS